MKFLKTWSVISLILLFNPGNIFSQTSLTEEKKADILSLMEITRASEIGSQFATAIMQQMGAVMKNSGTALPDTVIGIIQEEVIKIVKEEAFKEGGLLSMVIPIYDKYFTHDEIKELLKFYKTDIGRKTISVMPSLLQESMMAGRLWGQSLAPLIKERMIKRLKELGFNADPLERI